MGIQSADLILPVILLVHGYLLSDTLILSGFLFLCIWDVERLELLHAVNGVVSRHKILAPARRRPRPVRRLPALLQAARGAARVLLRARAPAATDRAHDLRALERLLRRPDREEAAQPLPARHGVLSFGTAGCNLACKFCQNWDISKSREIDTLADQAAPGAIARAAEALGCRSVAFTYNDPVIFAEYAIDVGAGVPRARHQGRGRHRRLHHAEPRARVLPLHGRRQRGPEGIHRGVLSRRSAVGHLQPVLDTLG